MTAPKKPRRKPPSTVDPVGPYEQSAGRTIRFKAKPTPPAGRTVTMRVSEAVDYVVRVDAVEASGVCVGRIIRVKPTADARRRFRIARKEDAERADVLIAMGFESLAKRR